MLTNGPAKKQIALPPIESCDGRCDATGRCDPRHPLHCCHLAHTVYEYYPSVTWRCAKCGRFGKWLIDAKNGRAMSTTVIL